MPGNPLSDERLHEKFLRCAAAGGIEPLRARELLSQLDSLQSAGRVQWT
jgi:hypothetical protein